MLYVVSYFSGLRALVCRLYGSGNIHSVYYGPKRTNKRCQPTLFITTNVSPIHSRTIKMFQILFNLFYKIFNSVKNLQKVNEGATIAGVGILCFSIFPGAFVNLDLEKTPNWAKIRIFCAGVWHNLVLCLTCFIALKFQAELLSPLYHSHLGYQVTSIEQKASIRLFLSLLKSWGLCLTASVYQLKNR